MRAFRNLAICFLLGPLADHCLAQQLSEQATVSVLTCGADQREIYLAFGHSALRIKDPRLQMDLVFNYGVFDFEQPNFLLNFALGRNLYALGVHRYDLFEESYIADNRFVHEQTLDLTLAQRQRIFEFLMWNAQPENRSYLYDYFYDNCATRIRDVIADALGDSVNFDGSYIQTKYTIRQLTDIYLSEQPWGDLGIDICLGLPMDKVMEPWEYMFIPDYVESGVAHASVVRDGTALPLVKDFRVVYASAPTESTVTFPHPFVVFGGFFLFVVGLSVRDYRRKKTSNWFDAFLFGTTGVVGILLALLWLFTDHKAAANNFNLLWAIPSHAVVVFLLRRRVGWIRKYFLATMVLEALLLVTWAVLPQQLNVALIPLVAAVLARSGVQYYLRAPGGLP